MLGFFRPYPTSHKDLNYISVHCKTQIKIVTGKKIIKWDICPPVEDRLQDTQFVSVICRNEPSLSSRWNRGSSRLFYSSFFILMTMIIVYTQFTSITLTALRAIHKKWYRSARIFQAKLVPVSISFCFPGLTDFL